MLVKPKDTCFFNQATPWISVLCGLIFKKKSQKCEFVHIPSKFEKLSLKST